MKTILVVDDEPLFREVFTRFFSKEGFHVLGAEDAARGLACLHQSDVHLVVLDYLLPDMNGAELAKLIHLLWPVLPLIMITGYPDAPSSLAAEEVGAGYLIKPPEPSQLKCAVLRALSEGKKHKKSEDQDSYLVAGGDLLLDIRRQEVLQKRALLCSLTAMECKLLACLMKNIGEVVGHDTLRSAMQKDPMPGRAQDFTRRYIYRLRQKIETNPHHPRYIHTKGIGYVFQPPTGTLENWTEKGHKKD